MILRRMGADKCALTAPPVVSLPSGYTDEVVVWVDEWRDLRFKIIPICVEYHVVSERDSDIRDPWISRGSRAAETGIEVETVTRRKWRQVRR